MKLIKTTLFLTLIIFLNITLFFPQQIIKRNKKPKKDSKPFIEGEIIVKFKNSASSFTIKNTNKKYNTTIKPYSKKDSNLKLLEYDKKESIDIIINKYNRDPNVEYVQPNYVYSIFNATPDDTYFSYQWGLENINDCDVDASSESEDSAWDVNTGSSSIIVAVIDTGVDYLHEDLIGNIWTNGSGFHGYDYIDNDTDPMDLEGHGTIVAGIIGAVANNSKGISGTAQNVKIMSVRGLDEDGYGTTLTLSQAINYAVTNGAQIINASWGGNLGDTLLRNAIENARDNNVLFVAAAGNGGADGIGDDNSTTSIYPANYHIGVDGLKNIISVAASDQNDNLAGFSNYGENTVHVCAPGVNIISTIPTFSYVMININEKKDIFIYSFLGFLIFFPALFFNKKKKYFYKKLLLFLSILLFIFITIKCVPPENEKSSSKDSSDPAPTPQKVVTGHTSYTISNGTSVAAPFITGIAVLMKSENSALTPSEIISYLSNTSNSEDYSGTNALNNRVISDGRINARTVLNAVVADL